MGYHIKDIKKGVIGEISKIVEETEELQDAMSQGCKIMELLELSDIYGAMEAYLRRYHPHTTMEDIAKMSELTKRAFNDGSRQ